MNKAIAIGIIGAAVSLAMLAFGFTVGSNTRPTMVQPPETAGATTALDEHERAEVEAVIRDYLMDNPEILVDMQTQLEDRQRQQERVAQQDVIQNNAATLFDSDFDGVYGNPDGDVTIVEFFDYNCGFCQRAHADMIALVEADPDLRFVLKEFPILGPDSQRAHMVSMAFQQVAPERYADFHHEVMTMEDRATAETTLEIALEHGVDEEELDEAMQDPAILEAIASTYELADQLSITGTPSYVIGNEVVFGALGRDVLAERVAFFRETEAGGPESD